MLKANDALEKCGLMFLTKGGVAAIKWKDNNYTRVFGDGPRHFELWLGNENDTSLSQVVIVVERYCRKRPMLNASGSPSCVTAARLDDRVTYLSYLMAAISLRFSEAGLCS
ncbi:hypothetical protein TNCV_4154451 [Trichonephila clavipes]|nr:hypothetical protein TNCV_4154451 [Trichonephila clavipes]